MDSFHDVDEGSSFFCDLKGCHFFSWSIYGEETVSEIGYENQMIHDVDEEAGFDFPCL